ncbi:hypothetical protein [Kineosporia mesophila]|uniref:hypothetical protein n=1 Tax=Kineosporia mesophila TaxID=566012 RepID=UPI001E2FC50F|nr:hypothetical protein [Kineosporia mesophila]MCD5353029.1 hypothetical protein [Kineosporia mesophila]
MGRSWLRGWSGAAREREAATATGVPERSLSRDAATWRAAAVRRPGSTPDGARAPGLMAGAEEDILLYGRGDIMRAVTAEVPSKWPSGQRIAPSAGAKYR